MEKHRLVVALGLIGLPAFAMPGVAAAASVTVVKHTNQVFGSDPVQFKPYNHNFTFQLCRDEACTAVVQSAVLNTNGEADGTVETTWTFDGSSAAGVTGYLVETFNGSGAWHSQVQCRANASATAVPGEDGRSVAITFVGRTPDAADVRCHFVNNRFPQIDVTKFIDESPFGSRESEPAYVGWPMKVRDASDDSEIAGGDTGPSLELWRHRLQLQDLDSNTVRVCEELSDPDGTPPADSTHIPSVMTGGTPVPTPPAGEACQDIVVDWGGTYPVSFGNVLPVNLTVTKVSNPAASWLDWTISGVDRDLDGDVDVDDDFTLSGANDGTSTASYTVSPGSFTIMESGPSNWDATAITCGIDGETADLGAGSIDVDLVPGADVTCTFTNERQPQIRITKYEDLDGNGTRGEGEPGIEGWQMFLYISDGQDGWTQVQPREVRSDANGVANYTGLEQGKDHLVCEEQMEGWMPTEPAVPINYDGKICQLAADLQYGEVRDVVFGNLQDDGDGVPPEVENETPGLGPNGNGDDKDDWLQKDVSTLPGANPDCGFTVANNMELQQYELSVLPPTVLGDDQFAPCGGVSFHALLPQEPENGLGDQTIVLEGSNALLENGSGADFDIYVYTVDKVIEEFLKEVGEDQYVSFPAVEVYPGGFIYKTTIHIDDSGQYDLCPDEVGVLCDPVYPVVRQQRGGGGYIGTPGSSASPVPTVGLWGLGAMAALLGIMGGVFRRLNRRR